MNYISYSLILKENTDVELHACIDLDTIDDDEPDVEYLNNDGVWRSRPNYWKIGDDDLSILFEELKEIEVYEWNTISQTLIDCEMSLNEVFIKDFEKATLYVSYGDFDAEKAIQLPSKKEIKNTYPRRE